jgi:hypothetical protein
VIEPPEPEPEPEPPDDEAGEEAVLLQDVHYVPVLGPINSLRLAAYHRLDLRASRTWRTRWGRLDAFVDVQNVYDRQNVAGYDWELDEDTGELNRAAEPWAGILPTIGIHIEF